MKSNTFFLAGFILIAFLSGCKDDTNSTFKPNPGPDYSENYKYFPLKDKNQWVYRVTEVIGTEDTIRVTYDSATYNKGQGRIEISNTDGFTSYQYWSNTGNKLMCCGDRVLVDYSLLGCTEDSMEIYYNDSISPKMQIFQYCERPTYPELVAYGDVKILKTLQINRFNNQSKLVITSGFGHGIGLIFRHQVTYGSTGIIEEQQLTELVNHNF